MLLPPSPLLSHPDAQARTARIARTARAVRRGVFRLRMERRDRADRAAVTRIVRPGVDRTRCIARGDWRLRDMSYGARRQSVRGRFSSSHAIWNDLRHEYHTGAG